MPKNNYKSFGDLAKYLNSKRPFSKNWISVDDILYVFEKAFLIEFDNELGYYVPTDYLRNCGGCFVTKNGKILFTEPVFNLMIKNTKLYKKEDWFNWFCDLYGSSKKQKKPLDIIKLNKTNKFLVFMDDGIHIIKANTKNDVLCLLYNKYKNPIIDDIRGFNIKSHRN